MCLIQITIDPLLFLQLYQKFLRLFYSVVVRNIFGALTAGIRTKPPPDKNHPDKSHPDKNPPGHNPSRTKTLPDKNPPGQKPPHHYIIYRSEITNNVFFYFFIYILYSFINSFNTYIYIYIFIHSTSIFAITSSGYSVLFPSG